MTWIALKRWTPLLLLAAAACDGDPVSAGLDSTGEASTGEDSDQPVDQPISTSGGMTTGDVPGNPSTTEPGLDTDPDTDGDTDTDTDDVPEPVCGNGVMEPGESCDGTDIPEWEDVSGCEFVTGVYEARGSLSCNDDCTINSDDCNWCGDEVTQFDDESCDGDAEVVNEDGQPVTCEDVLGPGHVGTITCAYNCVYSTDDCVPLCGNGELDDGEACDGEMFAAGAPPLCASELGDGYEGLVSCDDDCQLETTGCESLCGNGEIDPGEDCDAFSLQGATCLDFGDAQGVLGCTDTCTYDTQDCTCGNGLIDGDEACDGLAVGTTCDDLVPGAPGAPTCNADCTLDPGPCGVDSDGTLVISELMPAPLGAPLFQAGEWIELHNSHPTETASLAGCALMGTSALETGPLPGVSIPPGGYATLGYGTPDDLGFTPDGALPPASFFFNDGDLVRLECAGILVDEIEYEDGAPWPGIEPGRSIVLEADALDTESNDAGSAWCPATQSYAKGYFGTPGSAGGCD